jgi:hypothetical protein
MARPLFRRQRDAMDNHLTLVFAGLDAIACCLQNKTGVNVRRLVRTYTPCSRSPSAWGGDHSRRSCQWHRGPGYLARLSQINALGALSLCQSGLDRTGVPSRSGCPAKPISPPLGGLPAVPQPRRLILTPVNATDQLNKEQARPLTYARVLRSAGIPLLVR